MKWVLMMLGLFGYLVLATCSYQLGKPTKVQGQVPESIPESVPSRSKILERNQGRDFSSGKSSKLSKPSDVDNLDEEERKRTETLLKSLQDQRDWIGPSLRKEK